MVANEKRILSRDLNRKFWLNFYGIEQILEDYHYKTIHRPVTIFRTADLIFKLHLWEVTIMEGNCSNFAVKFNVACQITQELVSKSSTRDKWSIKDKTNLQPRNPGKTQVVLRSCLAFSFITIWNQAIYHGYRLQWVRLQWAPRYN